MIQFSATGMLAVMALLTCWALAVVLYRLGISGSIARKLSLLLFVEGLTLISTGYIDLFLTDAAMASQWYPQFYRVEIAIHTLGDCLMIGLYLSFLPAALQTRLTRPLASKRVQGIIWSVLAVLFIAILLNKPETQGQLVKALLSVLYLLLTLLFLFALVASVHAWRVATGTTRERARAFAFAFGIRDACWGFVYAGAIWLIWNNLYEIVDDEAGGVVYIVYALGTLLAVPLIAYGILRTQLFDIDLRIRWTIKQSTLAAVFVSLVYLISEGADRYLSTELGNWVGLIASAIVVFFLAPLQRMAERVASAAMPNTVDTPEYAAYRKMQVYESALVETQPGGISDKERALLNRLRISLGIAEADALALEASLQPPAAG